jgi:hypothetical protein
MSTMTESFSPFGGFSVAPITESSSGERGEEASPAAPPPVSALASPFGTLTPYAPGEAAASEAEDAVRNLLQGLHDEDFTDALEALVDEAAARHALDLVSWSTTPSVSESHALLEAWIEPLAGTAERALDSLAERLAGLDAATVTETELSDRLETPLALAPLDNEVFEQFLGGLIKKAKSLARGAVDAVKKGVAAVGKILPVGMILNRLKGLVRSLLSGVLRTAISKLPEKVQPIARSVAAKLGIAEAEDRESGTAEMLAEAFDAQLVGLATGEESPAEAEAEFESPTPGGGEVDREGEALRDLGEARDHLADQLANLAPGESAAPAVQQFLPALMAARPLIKMALGVIGRDRVIGFVSDRIAGLVSGLVGQDAARQLARPLVDLGFRALGLEAPVEPTRLAGEALASTVEGAMERLLELPAEALSDELQLEAALQTAFAEAAAAAVPDRFLRADLPEREVAGESGVWVMMPRAARPHYRYRRYSKVFLVPVTRQTARTLPWSDGGNLETYLLDRGVRAWPAPVQIRVYEALPGTQLGHLTEAESGPGTAAERAQEFQPLTPEMAGLLIGEPRLGVGAPRRPGNARRFAHVRPMPGRAGLFPAVRRPRRRVGLGIVVEGPSPHVRVRLRLTERQGQELAAKLAPSGAKPDLPGALAMLKDVYARTLPGRVVKRLGARGLEPDPKKAAEFAERLMAAVTTALSARLQQAPHLVGAAVRDPADGITITVTFSGVTRESLQSTLPTGTVEVTPGWRVT